MRIGDLTLLSLSNLWKRKLRTLLTVLGVVIGITSIIVMVALGNGLKQSMLSQINNESPITEITVMMDTSGGNAQNKTKKMFDDKLMEEFASMEHVKGVIPSITLSILAKSGQYVNYLNVCAMREKDLVNLNIPIKEGKMPKENGKVSMFYGSSVITGFYIEKTGLNPYYEKNELPKIDLMKNPIFLIYDTDNYNSSSITNSSDGKQPTTPAKKYLTPTAGLMAGNPGEYTSKSYAVYCEIDSLKAQLKKVFRNRAIPGQPTRKNAKPYKDIYYSQFTIQVDELKNVQPLTKTLRDLGYDASSSAEWIDAQMKQMNSIQAVLGAIGAVSLLVAAIGITNTMMMSIYERTKEIGVLKVLGCDMRNIQEMFLLEAGCIGLLGGIAGIILSYSLGAVINYMVTKTETGAQMGLTSAICVVPLWLPSAALLFAIAIGMIAGLLPSIRAMRLSPLAAIKNE